MTRVHNAQAVGIKQAFEDFVSHEAERAIAEATMHQHDGRRLWVVLYDDGRFGTEHSDAENPATVVGARETASHIAFPIEPLRDDEWDRARIEDACFDRPLESLWAAYDQALNTQLPD